MQKLRLIQTGVGGMGRALWNGAIKGNAKVDLVAIVDINDAALADCGDALSIPKDRHFKSLESAISAVPADAVLNVTPPANNLRHAELTFAAGLHLLTEKPIAIDLSSAKRMVALAEAAGRQLVVAQNYRYNPPIVTLTRLMRQLPLGPLGHGHIDFYIPGDFRQTYRKTMEYPLLLDMAIHHVDLIRAITGRDIVKVHAQTFRPEWSWYDHHPGLNMLMELEDGLPFSYHGDWSARGRSTSWNGAWRLQCEQGSIELMHDQSIIRTTSGFWHENIESQPIPHDEISSTGQRAILDRFIESIRTGAPAETNGKDNLWSFAAVSAGVISAREGRTVDVRELLNA